MRLWALVLAGVSGVRGQASERLSQALARVSEEAEAFAAQAPKMLSEETLRQRALLGPARFRPRIGQSALKLPPPRVRTREVISEFGYSRWKDAPGILREFRQPVLVDGRRVKEAEKARATLTLGVLSADDRIRKQMLRDFEKLGLTGAATDLTPLLLLFLRQNLSGYDFTLLREDRTGADTALVIGYRQRAGPGGLTIFEGRSALRQRLAGELWVRLPDSLPLRITLVSERQEKQDTIRDDMTVDYAPTAHATLAPVAAVYRQYVGGVLRVENLYQYSPFRRFSAAAEIKFTEIPEIK